MPAELQPLAASNDLLADPAALRQRLADDGYLFFCGVGPRDKILAARRDVLRLCHDAGWCDLEGYWTGAGPFTEGDPQYMAVYKNVIKLPSFLAVPEDPAMTSVVGKILDAPPMLHRLRIGRITFPNNVAQTTAAHQDHWYIRGAEETYTIWTPLGDCPRELGGLAVLPGSHRRGFIEHGFDATKKYAGHGLADDQLSAKESDWRTSDFAAGDFLLFHSLTVHKALPNTCKDRLRISTDNRYQRAGEPIADVSRGTHYNL
jgi:ectoine hydroxylase-related dioxygenase (phytanoyl-CoA dioxygenase family)